MDGLKIDYGELRGIVVDAKPPRAGRSKRSRWSLGAVLVRALKSGALLVVLATLPFFALIRGGVFAYRSWGLGTWASLAAATVASAALLWLYAWLVARKLGAGRTVHRVMTRGAAAVGIAYVAYGLVFIASANVKTDDIRTAYASVHPLLRIASSLLILVDPASVVTDAGRTPEDYFLMGLSRPEASLHFEQPDGFVHALDFRTTGRPEWRNRAAELAFWAMGFHALRHVGTADHLHVSLRPPA